MQLRRFQCDIVDGSGAPSRTGDVAVDGERIVAIGDCSSWHGDEVFDASGLVLAPGFIDCHTHDDRAVLSTPDMAMKVSQGVTSVVAGNCGISLAPFEAGHGLPPPFPLLGQETDFAFPNVRDYRQTFERKPPALNLALLAGHSSLRVNAMKDRLDRPAGAQELSDMADRLRMALRRRVHWFQYRPWLPAGPRSARRRDHRPCLGVAGIRPCGLCNPHARRRRSCA